MFDTSNPPFDHVRACWCASFGLVVEENRRARPSSLDDFVSAYGQDKLDTVMENRGQWVEVFDLFAGPCPNPLANLSADEVRRRLFASYDEAHDTLNRLRDRVCDTMPDAVYARAEARAREAERELDRCAKLIAPYLRQITLPAPTMFSGNKTA